MTPRGGSPGAGGNATRSKQRSSSPNSSSSTRAERLWYAMMALVRPSTNASSAATRGATRCSSHTQSAAMTRPKGPPNVSLTPVSWHQSSSSTRSRGAADGLSATFFSSAGSASPRSVRTVGTPSAMAAAMPATPVPEPSSSTRRRSAGPSAALSCSATRSKYSARQMAPSQMSHAVPRPWLPSANTFSGLPAMRSSPSARLCVY
mmetsp:Transcript_39969/g.102231  ORF Transcript_39969/g.102231 Transcript_39969/m.102231 type:complete len:205 (-) Transcript_39969:119-733(-)